jgi:hypothetical protein
VVNKTSNFHTRTLAEIAQIVFFKENPPDTLAYKTLPTQAQTIAMAIRMHAQEWLKIMSKVTKTTSSTPKKHKT